MAGNIRNARTTHPRKAARRARAADRFTVDRARFVRDQGYRVAKQTEAKALGISI